MAKEILGIHHVTAISSDPQQTIDFYNSILGLRLVKLTVNYDDPATYHLYFGDELGHPGTIFTFFPWPGAPKGRKGTGQLISTAFSIPEKALDYWTDRLKARGISLEGPNKRFGKQVLSFTDVDGQGLELVVSQGAEAKPAWKQGPVPAGFAIRGFHGVTLSEQGLEGTESLLMDVLGFRLVGEQENRFRYEVGNSGTGTIVDVLSQPGTSRGFVSVGTVHHVAFRTPDEYRQKEIRQEILKVNPSVTPVIDRKYFHSIYFREPGGVLFEVATDPPGFMVDETIEELGTRLMLPSWLDPQRESIEKTLPRVRVPKMVPAK